MTDSTPRPAGPKAGGNAEEKTAVFLLGGMDHTEEEALVRAALASLPGVRDVATNLLRRTVTVRGEPAALAAVSGALLALGLDARLLDEKDRAGVILPAARIPWARLALAGLFAALSEAAELLRAWQVSPFGLDWQAVTVKGANAAEWLPLLLAVPAIALAGLATYKKGWLALSRFTLNINALMSVAVTGAVIIGQYPEAAMVMVLFTLAEAIEARALDRARTAIKNLLALTPERATVFRPAGERADGAGAGAGEWVEMDIRLAPVGSRVRVRPGEKIGLDGVVALGRSAVNQAPITGESLPVEKTVGDTVYAGAINESGSFEFIVTAASADSTLARIIHRVEEAQSARAPTQRFVDRFAAYYTPAVFGIAVLAGLVPPLFLGGPWKESVYTALVLLVVGCPCALVISTPVSIVSGLAAATRHGILIKGGTFLEQGRLLTWLALDKTGTVTHGKPRLTDVEAIGGFAEDLAETVAASLAARSDHPVSRAVAEYAAERKTPLLPVEAFTAVPGQGVSGTVEGRVWFLGNHRMVEEERRCSPALEERISRLERQGKTVVALMDDGVRALFAVADTVKPSSIAAVRELRALGVKTMMLTGDNEHTAGTIAKQAGVDGFQANLLPEDKLRVVEALRAQGGRVGMAGDGINDAPALAGAHIGFAMAKGGTDAAIETADVALMDDDLRKIPRFIRLSRVTRAVLVQNIALALGVKAVFFVLAFLNLTTMWMAVLADVGMALVVVANGLRLTRK